MSRITRERMLEITAESDKYEIALANDPTTLGPSYLQDMIANCRNYTNHAARLLNEVHRAKMVVHMDLCRKRSAFKIAADELLATNAIVRNLPNIKDRESQINIMLRDEHREIMNLENDDLELGHIEEYVRRRHRELKDTMKEIQTQRNLIKDEHATGGMYGDERPTSMGGSAFTPGASSKPEGMDVEDIERMLNETSETPVETPEEESPKVVVQTASEPVDEPTTEPDLAPVVEKPVVLVEPVSEPLPAPVEAKSEEDEIREFLDASNGVQSVVPEVSEPAFVERPAVSEDDFTELLNTL